MASVEAWPELYTALQEMTPEQRQRLISLFLDINFLIMCAMREVPPAEALALYAEDRADLEMAGVTV